MTQSALFWTRIARRYAARPIPDMDAYDATLERTAAYLHPTDSVLELGCGTGTTALRLARHAGHYLATDYAPGMIEIGREKAWNESPGNLRLEVAEPGSPSLAGQHFDAVLAFNLFHLVRDPMGALTHVRSYVKPGGHFISKTPCLGGRGLTTVAIRTVVAAMGLIGKAPSVTFLRTQTWYDAIEEAGFEIIERGTYPASGANRFVVARRTS